jgi:hypothetical protein
MTIANSMRSMKSHLVAFAIMVLFIPLAEQRWATAQLSAPDNPPEEVMRQYEKARSADLTFISEMELRFDARDHVLREVFGLDPEIADYFFITDMDGSITVYENPGEEVVEPVIVAEGVYDGIVFDALDYDGSPRPADVLPVIGEDTGAPIAILTHQRQLFGGTIWGEFGSAHISAARVSTEYTEFAAGPDGPIIEQSSGLVMLSIESTQQDAIDTAARVSDANQSIEEPDYLCYYPPEYECMCGIA